jgi:lipid-A-disaccharide synthase
MPQLIVKGFNKKVWILAGEASGDLYGARLAEELLALSPALTLQGMGGDRMREAGVTLLQDASDMGIVGFVEVLKHLPMFWRIFNRLVKLAESEKPEVVVLIDYPGFNLRFARQMHRRGIKVVYYISPQVWAWGQDRVQEITRIVDHMLVIFPFEAKFYERCRLPVTFVGHPLLEILRFEDRSAENRQKDLIALLPGSRMSEVSRLLRPLLETAATLYRQQPRYRFVIPLPNEQLKSYAQNVILELWSNRGTIPIEVVAGETERMMRRAVAGIAASGTVTVQAAILGLPLVVIYKLHPITYLMARRAIKVKYFTMVNLVTDQVVFEEFAQGDVVPAKLAPALARILPDGARRKEVEEGMRRCVSLLRGKGNPSQAAAKIVLGIVRGPTPTTPPPDAPPPPAEEEVHDPSLDETDEFLHGSNGPRRLSE